MMIVRAGPTMSAVAGPRSRTHIMLNRMCSRLPCSHVALSTSTTCPAGTPGTPRTEQQQRRRARRRGRRIRRRDLQLAAGHEQRQHVQHRRRADDERHEPEVGAELAESRAKPQSPGFARPHCSTCRRARRRATRTTDRRPNRWCDAETRIPVLTVVARRLALASGRMFDGENPLPQADAGRRHFHQLVVVDELDRLLEAEPARRNQPDGFVGARGAHVGLLLLLRDVDVHVARAGSSRR